MAYDFRQLNRENQRIIHEMKIIVDGELFNPTRDYNHTVKSIIFENVHGSVQIDGYLELPRTNLIPEIIKLNKYSVKFHHSFLQRNGDTDMYQYKILHITFNNISGDSEFLRNPNFTHFLESKGAFINPSLDNKLTIRLKSICDIDLRPFMRSNFDENYDYQNRSYSGFQMSLDLNNRNTGTRLFRDENGNNRRIDEVENLIQGQEFLHETLTPEHIPSPVTPSNFIDFEKDSSAFDFNLSNLSVFSPDENSNVNIEFIDPYHVKENEKLRKFKKNFHNASFKICFNQKGEFISRGAFNKNTFRHEIKIGKIVPNNSLILTNSEKKSECIEFYHKNTTINYINTLWSKCNELEKKTEEISRSQIQINDQVVRDFNDSPINFNSNSRFKRDIELSSLNSMNTDSLMVNDYTFILKEYINDLSKYRDLIKSMNFPNDKRSKKVENDLFQKLDREISTLKLFKILFLNCFIDKSTSSSSSNGINETSLNNVESLREEVKRMRKKKLIDWMIENTEKEFQTDFEGASHLRSGRKEEILYSQILNCLLYGRIRRAIEICNKNGLFDLAMMISTTNTEARAKLIETNVRSWETQRLYTTFPADLRLIYNVLSVSPLEKDENLKSILGICDWKKTLIFSSLYLNSPSTEISTILKNFDLMKSKNLSNSIIPCNYKELKEQRQYEIENINYLLISLYAAFESKTPTNDTTPLISNILKKICYTSNIFSYFADHHLHYIIITILLNTLKETYNRSNVADTIFELKGLHFKLLTKAVEEILIFEGSKKQSDSNWKFAISLISYSNTPKKMQNMMINDILFKFVSIAHRDPIFKNEKAFEKKVSLEALALFKLNEFYIRDAYNYFKESGNLDKANEIFIFYILTQSLVNNNITNDNEEEIKFLKSVSTNVYFWEKYGTIFSDYLLYLNLASKNKVDRGNLQSIHGLIKTVEAINTNTVVYYGNLINYCRNIMLSKLREIYNKISHVDQMIHVCLTPNMIWIKDPNLSLDTKLKEFNYSIDSLIMQKNQTFYDN